MQKLIWGVLACLATSTAFAGFQSPTGNIICDEFDGVLLCSVHQRNNVKPAIAKPKSCDLDWGDIFGLGATGKPYLECHGDYPFENSSTYATLPYGSSIQGNGWQCTSRQTGMTCKNRQGRGFTLSRNKQTLF